MRALKILAALMLVGLASLAVLSPAQAYERWLRIHNDTGRDVCYVYISHVDTGDWGYDLLGPDTCISPGDVVRVDPGFQQGYCRMDLRFEFRNGAAVHRWNYNICDGTDFYVSNAS